MNKEKKTIVANIDVRIPVAQDSKVNCETLQNNTNNLYDIVTSKLEKKSTLKIEVTHEKQLTDGFKGEIVANLAT